MDICIYGGSFDPIHKGHIKIALDAIDYFNFQKLIFMVSYEPPHKASHNVTFNHRYNMVNLAIKNYDNLEVTDIENNGSQLSYTYNSLKTLKEKYENDNLYFLVGSDIFATIKTWYKYNELFDLATFVVGLRHENSFDNMINNIPNDIKNLINNKIKLFNMDAIDISSSKIRENIKKYLDYLPENVAEYIIENNLYETLR